MYYVCMSWHYNMSHHTRDNGRSCYDNVISSLTLLSQHIYIHIYIFFFFSSYWTSISYTYIYIIHCFTIHNKHRRSIYHTSLTFLSSSITYLFSHYINIHVVHIFSNIIVSNISYIFYFTHIYYHLLLISTTLIFTSLHFVTFFFSLLLTSTCLSALRE